MDMPPFKIVTALATIFLLVSSNAGSSASFSVCMKQEAVCAKGCMTAFCPNGKGVPGGCGPQWEACFDTCSTQFKACLK